MFTQKEIDALVLGIRMVSNWSDADFSRATRVALAKVEAVLPDEMKKHIHDNMVFSPPAKSLESNVASVFQQIREAIRKKRKVSFQYVNNNGEKFY